MLGLVTYSAILLALLIATWRRPAIGLAAVLCLYGLKQWGQASTALLFEYRQFTNYAVFAICLLGLARAAVRRGCVFCGVSPTAWGVLALYAYALLSTLWAPDLATSLDQWVLTGPYLLTITLLAPLLIEDTEDARGAFMATALAGAALCALALLFGHWGDRGLLMYGHEALQDEYNIYKYETNPLALSTLAGTVFVICGLSLGRPNGPLLRVLALVCIPVTLFVILRSGSRGQVIASILSVLIALPVAFRPKDSRSVVMLVFAGGVVLALAGLAITFVDFSSGRWTNAQATIDAQNRFAMAQRLLDASTASLLTTLFGLGNSSAFTVVGFYPHITVLEVIAEEGVLGAVLYLALLFFGFRSVRRIARRADLTDRGRNTLAILFGLFVFELILSWKQGSLLFSAYVFAYAIMLARLEKPHMAAAPHTAVGAAPVLGTPRRFEHLLP